MEKTLPPKVLEAKEKGNKVIVLTSETGEKFYFKKPGTIDIAYFQDQIAKSTNGLSTIQDKFLRSLFLGEDSVSFDQYLKEKPLAVSKLLMEVCANLGAEENFISEEI